MHPRRELDAMHRAHAPFVRTVLGRYAEQVQPADLKDIEQLVWMKMLKRLESEGRFDDVRGYLATTIRNAVIELLKKGNRKKCDRRITDSLIVEADSGPIDRHLASDAESPSGAFERRRTVQRIQAIASQLAPREAEIYARLIDDYDSVSATDLRRLVLAMKKIMDVPARPRSIEHPDLVEGPSHCGRTVRRLGLATNEDEEEEVDEDDEILDAAE